MAEGRLPQVHPLVKLNAQVLWNRRMISESIVWNIDS